MINKAFMICLSKALNTLGESAMRDNKNLAIRQFIIYTTPAQLGLFGKYISMVCKVDMNNQTMTPEIVITSRQNELVEMLDEISNKNMGIKYQKAREESLWQSIISDYSCIAGKDLIKNHFNDISKVLISSVVAQIVSGDIKQMLNFCNSVQFDRRRIMYGCENIGRTVIRDQNKFEFVDDGVNLIFVRPFFDNNGRLTNVNFKVEMSLEVLRANKNDRAF